MLIAIPSAPGAVIRRIVRHCDGARVRHRVLPSLGELVEGRVMYTQIREVQVASARAVFLVTHEAAAARLVADLLFERGRPRAPCARRC